MGKKIRERTAREQEIHDQIIDRLLAGESPKLIGEEIGVSPSTLRTWKAKRLKEYKEELESRSDALTVYTEAKIANKKLDRSGEIVSVAGDVLTQTNGVSARTEGLRTRNDELGDELKALLLNQANVPSALLASLNGDCNKGLLDSHASFLQLFRILRTTLERGCIFVTNFESEDPLAPPIAEPLSVQQLKVIASMLKDLTKAFADLHLLPHGAMRSAPLRFGDSVPPQHLHLHSHGGRSSNPKGIDAIQPTIDAEYAAVRDDDLQSEQADLLSRM